MDSVFPKQKLRRCWLPLVCLLFFACAFSGCTYAECPVAYTLRGVLTDAKTGQPIQGARVAVSTSEREDISQLDKWASSKRTDYDGTFEDTVTVSGWNRHYLFGFIPLESNRPPYPAPLSNVYLYVLREPNRSLVPLEVPESKQQKSEPGHRWIDLGKVRVSLQEP